MTTPGWTRAEVCHIGRNLTERYEVIDVCRTMFGPARLIRKGKGFTCQHIDQDEMLYGPIPDAPTKED